MIIPTYGEGQQLMYAPKGAEPQRVTVVRSYVAGGGYQGINDDRYTDVLLQNGSELKNVDNHLRPITCPMPEGVEEGGWLRFTDTGEAHQITQLRWHCPDPDPSHDTLKVTTQLPSPFETKFAHAGTFDYDPKKMTVITGEAKSSLDDRAERIKDNIDPRRVTERASRQEAEDAERRRLFGDRSPGDVLG